SKISGTADISVRIMPKSNGVILNIRAKICSDCNVPEKMQEIIRGASTFTFNKLGIKVYKTNLTIVNLSNIQYEPSDINIQKPEAQKPEAQKPEAQKPLPVALEKETDDKAELQSYSYIDSDKTDGNSGVDAEDDGLK
ncbi:MAG: hypothetical protein NTZ89_03225, partial [Actinobacteria bacterium]|nr:hypothetical protein [Actinomycetota bacterium]